MAEVQTYSNSGEMTQRFIEFVMMQSQHAALFLGQIPNPETGQPTVNLEAAAMFISQLEMIADKTRGNLSNEESHILENALVNLQEIFVEVSTGVPAAAPATAPVAEAPEKSQPLITSDTTIDADSKKRFSKSYGA